MSIGPVLGLANNNLVECCAVAGRDIFNTVVRLVLLYGHECWVTKSGREDKISEAMIHMLRWMHVE